MNEATDRKEISSPRVRELLVITPAIAINEQTAANETDECSTICYYPECACRQRTIAGCLLPLAIEPADKS